MRNLNTLHFLQEPVMCFITLERFRKTQKKINMIHIQAEIALVLYVLYVLFCHFFKGVAPQTNLERETLWISPDLW